MLTFLRQLCSKTAVDIIPNGCYIRNTLLLVRDNSIVGIPLCVVQCIILLTINSFLIIMYIKILGRCCDSPKTNYCHVHSTCMSGQASQE